METHRKMKNKDLINLVDKKQAREAAKEAQRQQQADAQLYQSLQADRGKLGMEYQNLDKEVVQLLGYLENDKARFVELYTVVFLNALKRGLELAAAKKDALDAVTVLQELREELYMSAPENKDIREKIDTLEEMKKNLLEKDLEIVKRMDEITAKNEIKPDAIDGIVGNFMEQEGLAGNSFLDDGVDALPPSEPTNVA